MGRLLACVVVTIGIVASMATGHAQYVDVDGFSICPSANSARGIRQSNIGPCQPLTDAAMQAFGLSSGQKAIVAALQNFAANPGPGLLQRIASAKSLAEPTQFVATPNFSDHWLPDAADPDNVELGVHLRYAGENAKQELIQLTYTVDGSDGHFTVLWNRVLATPR